MYSAQFKRNKTTRISRTITPFHGHCFLRLSSFQKMERKLSLLTL